MRSLSKKLVTALYLQDVLPFILFPLQYVQISTMKENGKQVEKCIFFHLPVIPWIHILKNEQDIIIKLRNSHREINLY